MKEAMDNLFLSADDYLEKATGREIAVLKFCLLALGIAIGCTVKKEYRRPVIQISLLVFFATYIPLMARFLPCLRERFLDMED